ncbi:hypothetical protein CcrC1_gp140 [Caulobacter phage C1]|nr:hypothetical protein CcrC1_gp140 [Caulobacter phage C1]UTU08369.1 hypothetical protein CcrC2_gp141 [Caulobacter phage C2]UTU08886.1 hypothetical protein CcrJ4_gp135 [Caulobacter phage J4]UTU09442.1 hypothetical protein CcrBL47_gp156 [Caulobacter phage BL47]UTU10002.1 hypothetical protein CcrRB23_gp140 [Caulobacter phage RB23]WGN97027.1 hypothetical protein [Bertelyvirus sp.]
MIDNTFIQADGPLYLTLEAALEAPGAIYTHVKKGGIYRRMGEAKYAGDAAAQTLEGVMMAVYEHLYPYAHSFFVRPQSEFVEVVRTQHGEHRRFVFHTNEILTVLDT